jgi:hypothetical protein
LTTPAALAAPLRLRIALAAVLAAGAAAAFLLPWWRADGGAVLLGGAPVHQLPPDVWTGVEVAGPLTVLVVVQAGASVALAVLACLGLGRLTLAARCAAASAGLVAVAAVVRALVHWGPSSAAGVWIALAAGVGAIGTAVAPPGRELHVPVPRAARSGTPSSAFRYGGRRWVPAVATAATVAAAAALLAGPVQPPRVAAGPFVPVADVGAFPLRSGETGLSATDDARPVLADGAPGVFSRAGVVVADTYGRARVLAGLDRGAPAPIGVVGDRVVRWVSADAVAVTELRVGSSVDVVVRGVAEAGMLGADGSVWLRSEVDPGGTVRRLDVARLDGRQRIAATYLPVVTIQEPEPPVDLRTVLPVRGGGLRTLPEAGRLELLTGTAAGIATTPLAGSRCGAAGVASLDRAAADGSSVWFVLVNADGERLARLDPASGGAIRTVPTVLPGPVTALAAPGDGSVLFVARDPQGAVLWRLPDAVAALGAPPVSCPPA